MATNYSSLSHLPRQQRQQIADFQYKATMLLNDGDREYLYGIMKDYQRHRHLDKFMLCLRTTLDTPAKMDLLKDVRYFIAHEDLPVYDRLAPYHKMAHSWGNSPVHQAHHSPVRVVHGTPISIRSAASHRSVRPTPQPTPRTRHRMLNSVSTEVLANEPGVAKVVTLTKGQDEGLGFSIRGGSEHGLGIFISEVEEESPAARAGLEMGDHILEVNSVSFDNIASSSAVKVLTGSNKLKMIIRKLGKIPGFRSAKEKTSWYDVAQSRIIEGKFEEHGALHSPAPGLGYMEGVQRRINLTSTRSDAHMGFNIRGGSEYGLGIYVSKVDSGSVAEVNGLKVGDQILDLNGASFENISHANAVEMMKNCRQLMLTVVDTGKYPAFKEIYAEYRWIDANTGKVSKTRSSAMIGSVQLQPASPLRIQQEMYCQFPLDTNMDTFVHTDDEEDAHIAGVLGVSRYFPDVNLMNHSFGSSSLDIGIQTDNDSTQSEQSEKVLIPAANDLQLRERPLPTLSLIQPEVKVKDGEKVKDKGKGKKSKSPKSTLAIKAMELETRRQHPELVKEMEALDLLQEAAYSDVQDTPVETEREVGKSKRSRSLKGFFFGSKSKSSKGSDNGKNRKPLSEVNYGLKKSQSDTGEVFSGGVGSELAQNDACLSPLEDHAAGLLTKDEVKALRRHLSLYEREKDVDAFVRPLMAILDTIEKAQLFKQIRGVIDARDLARYDELVSHKYTMGGLLGSTNPFMGMLETPPPTIEMSGPLVIHDPSSQNTKGLQAVNGHKTYDSHMSSIQGDDNARRKEKGASKSRRSMESLQSLPKDPYKIPTSANDVEDVQILSSSDANYSPEIHRGKGVITVYEGILDGKSDSYSSITSDTHRNRNQENSKVTKQRDSENFKLTSQREAGISMTGSVSNNSFLHRKVSLSQSEPEFPVYSEVNKETKRHSSSELRDSNYIDSSELFPVYEAIDALDVAVEEVSLSNKTRSEPQNVTTPSTSQESLLSPSSSENLRSKTSNHSLNSSQSLSLSPPPSPHSDTSDDSTRHGSYTVNRSLRSNASSDQSLRTSTPVLKGVHKGENFSEDKRSKSPPVFVAPPPPDSPPPSEQKQIRRESDMSTGFESRLDDSFDPVKEKITTSIKGGDQTRIEKYDSTGSLRDIYKAKSKPRLNVADIAFSEQNSSATNPPGEEEEQDYIKMSNDLLQEFFRKSKGVQRKEHKKPSPRIEDVFVPPPVFNDQPENQNDHLTTTTKVPLPKNESPSAFKKQNGTVSTGESGFVVAKLDKRLKSLGLSISGGVKSQPHIKVHKVFPGGAAEQDGTLKPEMQLVSIDGQSVETATHAQTVDIIRKSFASKQDVYLHVVAKVL